MKQTQLYKDLLNKWTTQEQLENTPDYTGGYALQGSPAEHAKKDWLEIQAIRKAKKEAPEEAPEEAPKEDPINFLSKKAQGAKFRLKAKRIFFTYKTHINMD